MKDDEKFIELLEKFHKEDMMWFVLTSLISADSCIDVESCEMNLEMSNVFINVMDKCEKIPEEKRKEYLKYLKEGIHIIERDLEEFRKNREGN